MELTVPKWVLIVRRKYPQNKPKNTKKEFLHVLELTSDSLTKIKVEPHQCCINQFYYPKDQSIKFSQKKY